MPDVSRFAYLLLLLASWAAVIVVDRRLGLHVVGGRLVRALLVVLPLFLAFDVLGATRGWFASSAQRNILIVPPGLPLEEPVLLGFLCLLSVVLWRVFVRRLG